MPTESEVRAALKARKAYILDNAQTVTLKMLRKELEKDMGLEENALKPFKSSIGAYIDELMSPAEPSPKKEKKAASKQRGDSGSKSGSTKTTARVYSKRVDKMRSLCRQASITIPPNLYVRHKTDDALETALLELMDKHGLREDATPNDVARVKAKLQLARDLDGIDTSNIIADSGPGRRRRAAADNAGAAVRNYSKMVANSDEESEDDVEDEAQSESEEEEASMASEETGAESEGAEEVQKKETEKEEEGVVKSAIETEPETNDADSPREENKVAPLPAIGAKRASPVAQGDALGEISNAQDKRIRVAEWSDDDE